MEMQHLHLQTDKILRADNAAVINVRQGWQTPLSIWLWTLGIIRIVAPIVSVSQFNIPSNCIKLPSFHP